jgi:hypothetical protein
MSRRLLDHLELYFQKGLSSEVAFSCETEGSAVHGDINVFRKAVDEAEHFGQRCTALEAQLGSVLQREEMFERPADPKIFFDRRGRRTAAAGGLFEKGCPLRRHEFCEVVHRQDYAVIC